MQGVSENDHIIVIVNTATKFMHMYDILTILTFEGGKMLVIKCKTIFPEILRIISILQSIWIIVTIFIIFRKITIWKIFEYN